MYLLALFSYLTHLAKRRLVFTETSIEMDANADEALRIEAVGQSQPENGAQSVAGTLGAIKREPPHANMDTPIGMDPNQPVSTTSTHFDRNDLDQVVPVGPIKQENKAVFAPGEVIVIHSDDSDDELPAKKEPAGQSFLVYEYKAEIEALKEKNRKLVEVLQTRVLQEANSDISDFTPTASSTKKGDLDKENAE